MKKIRIFSICFLVSACNVPILFWEEEGRKVVDDIVDEEEKLSPSVKKKSTQKKDKINKVK